jgi:hypothetical protein
MKWLQYAYKYKYMFQTERLYLCTQRRNASNSVALDIGDG